VTGKPTPAEPWDGNLAERLALLRDGTIRVGYFYEVPESGSFRYRAYNMAQALNSYSSHYSGSYFFLSDIPLIEDFTDYVDVLVLVRFRFSGPLGRLIDTFRREGKPVLFDIDDLIFDVTHTPLVASSLNFGMEPGLVLDNWYALTSRLGHTLSLCDATITTTPTLATEATRIAGTPSFVIPNFLNNEQREASSGIRAEAATTNASFTLGYFSGSKSHALDFAVASPGIRHFLLAHPNARLVIAGILDLPQELESLEAQIDRLPFMDYVSLQRAISSVDLNIVPLQESQFTDSKSELKYFEAAAVGTPTIASPTEVFRRVLTPGHNGWVAGADEWAHQLTQLANLEAGEMQRVAEVARDDALATYTGEAQFQAIEQIMKQVTR
jgi:glycosyltransferase involved in cell wall biosynthesis